MRSRRGQILPLALIMIAVLSLFWVTLLNVGKLIEDRVHMQIAADTAVQSACAIRARALNSVGLMNSWLGIPGLAIGWPKMAWWPVPSHPMDGQMLVQKISNIKSGVKSLKKMIVSGFQSSEDIQAVLVGLLDGLLANIDLAYDIHPDAQPNYAALQQKFIHLIIQIQTNYVKTYGGGLAYQRAREIARLQGADDIYVPPRSFSLGLVRNHGPIWYLSTLHIWWAGRPLPPLPSLPNPDYIEDSPETNRWYEQGPNFYKKSMRLYAFRRPSSRWNGSFPLGQTVLPVSMPYLYAVAAARVFNPDGPMFPKRLEGDDTFAGYSALEAYQEASNGWQTQLVPVGGVYGH